MASRIGLLGGTFDPVHFGHLAITKSFLQSGHINELWVLLTPYPPHKEGANYAGYDVRLEMTTAAFSGIPNVQVSTIEDELPKPSFTLNTVRHLKQTYPDKEFFFCLGEDSIEQFHTWKLYEDILKEVRLLAALRPGYSYKKANKEILNRTVFIEHEPYKIASSDIRDRIKKGDPVDQYIPKEVEDIIKHKKLYID